MRSSNTNLSKPNVYYLLALMLIAGGYLTYQLAGIPNWVLGIDEFVYARHLYEFTYHLPYRDFQPFKPVLGLYVLSIPMFLAKGVLTPLVYIKEEIAAINAICLLLTGIFAAKIFDQRVIVLMLLALVVNGFFIYSGTDLRVDMLAGWLCCFALLAFLTNRHIASGMLLGIAFLVSQKAIWYIMSINGAMFCHLIIYRDTTQVKKAILFNAFIILPVALYIAIWSCFTSFHAVIDNVFLYSFHQATSQAFTRNVSFSNFQKLLTNSLLLFTLLPFALLLLFTSKRQHLVTIALITLFMALQMSQYKELFYYNYDFMLPVLFVVYASAITHLISYLSSNPAPLCKSNVLSVLSFLYFFAVWYVIKYFYLHAVAYLIAFMPILVTLLYSQCKQDRRQFTFNVIAVLFIVLTIIYPFYQIIYLRGMYEGKYQQAMLSTLDRLLAENGDYVAGVPYLYYKDQPISGIKNLIAPQIVYLWNPQRADSAILRETFYLAPVSAEQVINEFKQKNVKVIIDNKLMLKLPPAIKDYLRENYIQYYGSLYIYAPTISHQQNTFAVKFPGNYRIDLGNNNAVVINGVRQVNHAVIKLSTSTNHADASKDFRLILTPDINLAPIGSTANDQFYAMLK